MTKIEQREAATAERYMAAGMADAAARTLASLHRCASARSQREIAALIEARPAVRKHLTVVHGCYVER